MAVDRWRHYLEHNQFVIETNHESLRYLLEQKMHTLLQRKGLTKLLELNYQIQYRKGKKNLAVDALSRRLVTKDINDSSKMDGVQHGSSSVITTIVPAWHKEIQETYKNDPLVHVVLVEKLVNPYTWPQYTLLEGILRFKGRVVIGSDGNLRSIIVLAAHDSYLGDHAGIQNSYRRLKSSFYWPSMKKMVMQVVEEREIYKQAKLERNAYPRLLQPLTIPKEAWRNFTVNFLEDQPRSEGKDTIMVVVDRFSKFGHFVATSHPFTTQKVAQLFMDHLYKFHGFPTSIVTDRDKVFTSIFWRELFKKTS